MGIKASTEAISAMRSDIQKAISEITDISGQISAAGRATGDWSDAQSQQYQSVMDKASKATMQPLETLRAAIPKLNKLEQALQQYGSVKFN
jgi:uncharacterized protein YukE